MYFAQDLQYRNYEETRLQLETGFPRKPGKVKKYYQIDESGTTCTIAGS
ncbi:hypothetical protein [Scytonema sp. NUACC26]